MSIDDFVKQRAVDVAVGGSYVLPKWYDCEGKLRTFACRTKRVSPFRMIVDVPVVGKVGDRVSSYFKEFGEFQATISDVTQHGFLMELESLHTTKTAGLSHAREHGELYYGVA